MCAVQADKTCSKSGGSWVACSCGATPCHRHTLAAEPLQRVRNRGEKDQT